MAASYHDHPWQCTWHSESRWRFGFHRRPSQHLCCAHAQLMLVAVMPTYANAGTIKTEHIRCEDHHRRPSGHRTGTHMPRLSSFRLAVDV
ncbi:hypothetical protein PLICRDRAFT_52520 [Plicaturopsis crispa FD-325 SS-3]|nr:hypothetical protein PLICRDRAFT_52520 [Plicaturopsis crispa FD-325 SS-3]